MAYFRVFRANWGCYLLAVFLLDIHRAMMQSYFISLFAGEIRAAFGLL